MNNETKVHLKSHVICNIRIFSFLVYFIFFRFRRPKCGEKCGMSNEAMIDFDSSQSRDWLQHVFQWCLCLQRSASIE